MEFFTSKKRFVYMSPPNGPEKGSGEGFTSAAEAELKKVPEAVESALKSEKLSAEEAVKNANSKLEKITNDAFTKLENFGASAKDVDAYRSRIEAAREAAAEKIAGNKERYEKIATFVKKRTETELMLERNAGALKEAATNSDPSMLVALLTTTEGLNDTIKDVQGMDAPGMESDKIALTEKIGAQVKLFEQRADAIREFHKQKINSMDGVMKDVKDILDSGKTPRLEHIKSLNAHAAYLSMATSQLADLPSEKGLMDAMDKKDDEVMDVIMKAEQKFDTYASAESPEYKKVQEEVRRLYKNLDRAQQNKTRVMGNPKSTPEERKGANGWVAGAEQTYEKKLSELHALEQKVDGKRGAAPRIGVSVESFPEEEAPPAA